MINRESKIVMTWQDMDIGLFGWDYSHGKGILTFKGRLK
jgi:hypothetical protein